jgi:hypothetical protein
MGLAEPIHGPTYLGPFFKDVDSRHPAVIHWHSEVYGSDFEWLYEGLRKGRKGEERVEGVWTIVGRVRGSGFKGDMRAGEKMI